MRKKIRTAFLASVLAVIIPGQAFADLVFSAPPRGTEAEEKKTYEPLAQAMSQWLGTKVVYEYPKDFTTYSFRMRAGKYDLGFDGPHFASWRMARLNHKVLVNLPEQLVFLVVTPVANRKVTDLDSLIAKKVCGQAPPQLGTLFLMAQYTNPAREPVLQAIAGEANVYEALKSGSCEVAILRDKTYLKMTEAERATYRTLHSTRPVPNDALTAGPNVTPAQARILVERLTNPATAAVAKPIFDRFSKNAKSFETADPTQFAGLDQLLKDLSYGW